MRRPASIFCVLFAHSALSSSVDQAAPAASDLGFLEPVSWLTDAYGTYPPGLGEPLNVVVVGGHELKIVEDWMTSTGYAIQCLGLSLGAQQRANLGDGQDWLFQHDLYRWAYGAPAHGGACYESLQGGSHARWWLQSQTGAVFMAVSDEKNVTSYHDIVENGYDLGRDHLVGNATANGPTISPLTGRVFSTTARYASGYLMPGTDKVNHGIPIDGQVAILTITVLEDALGGLSKAAAVTLSVFFSASFVLAALLLWLLCPRQASYAHVSQAEVDAVMSSMSRRHEALERAVRDLRQRRRQTPLSF